MYERIKESFKINDIQLQAIMIMSFLTLFVAIKGNRPWLICLIGFFIWYPLVIFINFFTKKY